MATERNTLVSADEAQKLLDGAQHGPYMVAPDGDEAWLVTDLADADVATVFRNGDDPAVDRGNADLLAASWSLAETVVALHAEVAPRTSERDHAVAKAQQLARVLADAATPEDAVQLLSSVLVRDAASAPNCAEWRGSYSGREFAITVQWVDGKSPHALIDEARRERDDLRTQLDAATAELVQTRQEIARLQLTATATTDAEEALAGLVALKPAASRAYLEMDGGRTDTITPEEDSGAEPRLALTFDLGGTEGGEPWQALVIYDAGMGTVPVIAGECCESPRAAVASLREDLEPNHDADDDTEGDSCG